MKLQILNTFISVLKSLNLLTSVNILSIRIININTKINILAMIKKERVSFMIAITPTQKERLSKFGAFGESWSDIIEKLLTFYEKKH